MDKAELVITALQQRMGEMVANYETQIAFLRAELTQLSQDNEIKTQTIEDYNNAVQEKVSIENIDQC